MIRPNYVTSSTIDAVGFEGNTLYIRFRTGISYAYADVPEPMFNALRRGESAGGIFNKMIHNRYRHTKLAVDPFTGVQERRTVELRTVERREEGRSAAGRRAAERRSSLH